MAALEISPTKIGYVIVKARECAAKVAAWDDGATSDHDADSILESFSDDATREQLKAFIRDMNEDEQAGLVALAWIGRGSFGPEELDEALDTARSEHARGIDVVDRGNLDGPRNPCPARQKRWRGNTR